MATVKTIEDTQIIKKFRCEIEISEVNEKVETELQKIAQTSEVRGFRKGHAPIKMVKELYGAKTYNTAIDTLIKAKITEIGESGNYKLVASPSVEMDEEEKEKIAFTVTFELEPEMPKDFNFTEITTTVYEANIKEEELNKEIDLIAKKNRTFTTKEGKSEKGDIVVIDTIGRINGIEFKGGKLDNHELELGSGAFIPGFEDQLIGKEAGEEVIVNVTFPAEYHVVDMANKDASFYTKVKEVKKPEVAEINDELAKKLSFENLEALKAEVKQKIASFYKNAQQEKAKEKILDDLSHKLSFEVSENLAKRVAKNISEERKLPEEEIPNLMEEAKRRLRLSFFLNYLASEHKIKVLEQDFTNFVIENSSMSGMNPFQMLDFYSKNKEAKRRLEILLEENKIYDFIFNKINIKTEVKSKEELDAILELKNK
jgi:trigger factor